MAGSNLKPEEKWAVRVVSLPTALSRRLAIASRLAKIGIGFEFFDAVDGTAGELPDLNPEEKLDQKFCRRLKGCPLTAAEIACYLSHTRLWRQELARGTERLLVLEDDTRPGGDIAKIVKAWCLYRDRVPLLRLSFSRKRGLSLFDIDKGRFGGQAFAKALPYRLYRQSYKGFMSAEAYLIDRFAMARLLPRLATLRAPIDHCLGQLSGLDLPCFFLYPKAVSADSSFASIIDPVDQRGVGRRLSKGLKPRLFRLWHSSLPKAFYFTRNFYDLLKPCKIYR